MADLSISFLKHRSIVVLTLFIFVCSYVRPYCARADVVGLPLPAFQKGMCYVTWDKDRFASSYSDKSLEMLKDMGVEFVQVNVTLYQDNYNSTDIKATELTPSDKSVKYVIKKAHGLGLKVMLKPHIDLIDKGDGTYWRADIGFSDDDGWDKWFEEYKDIIKGYAKMADKNGVEILCVGTELSFTTQRADKWKEVIAAVRKVYSGKITYAANWDNYQHVEFWQELDFVGIDAYFPLTYKTNPSLDDIKKGWEMWKNELHAFYANVKKPIVFTEIGYSSATCAPNEPWSIGYGNPDVDMQARCYQAFFESLVDCDWLGGVYWWKWAPTVYGGGENNRNFTPLNKPAAKILELAYKNMEVGPGGMRLAYTGEVIQKKDILEKKAEEEKEGSFPMAGEEFRAAAKKD